MYTDKRVSPFYTTVSAVHTSLQTGPAFRRSPPANHGRLGAVTMVASFLSYTCRGDSVVITTGWNTSTTPDLNCAAMTAPYEGASLRDLASWVWNLFTPPPPFFFLLQLNKQGPVNLPRGEGGGGCHGELEPEAALLLYRITRKECLPPYRNRCLLPAAALTASSLLRRLRGKGFSRERGAISRARKLCAHACVRA